MQTVKHTTKHMQVMQLVRRLGIARPRDARAQGLVQFDVRKGQQCIECSTGARRIAEQER